MNNWNRDIETDDADLNFALNRRDLLIRGAMAGGLAVAAPLLLPMSARAQLFKKPDANKQREVGREAAKEIVKQYRVVKDSRARKFEEIGQALVKSLSPEDRQSWDFSYQVLESKELNAFALPGGPMFLFTGLYEKFETEDAIAAVTGHEMAHVYKEHWAKANKKAQERNAVAIGIGALLKGGRAAQTIASLTASVLGQKFSRAEEDEADALGLQNLVGARFNPQGMVQLFQTLEKAGGKGGPEFLSDHPSTGNRIQRTKDRIAQINQTFPALRSLR